MDLCIGKTLSQRPKSTNLSRRFRNFSLRRLSIINLLRSGERFSFGWEYEFGKSDITRAPDMPAFLLPVRRRAGKLFNIDPDSLVQTSIINNQPERRLSGTGTFCILALSSAFLLAQHAGCDFENIAAPIEEHQRDKILSMEPQPRSVYLMSGASRETWQHSFLPATKLRYAMMMRTLRAKP
jgi:hypothetical protein